MKKNYNNNYWYKYNSYLDNIKLLELHFKNYRHTFYYKDKICGQKFESPNEINIKYTELDYFLSELQNKFKTNKINKFYGRIFPYLPNNEQNEISKIMKNQKYKFYNEKYLNLNLLNSELTLKKNIRKSYKSIINKEENKIIKIYISASNFDNHKNIFNEWINLYSKAILRGGKKFPSICYNLLIESIYNNEAILTLAYENNKILGGMLFNIQGDIAYYSSAANSIDIENDNTRNIGHNLMWNSILFLKSIQVSNLNFGVIPSKNKIDNDRKLQNILFFKTGFGAKINTQLSFERDYEN